MKLLKCKNCGGSDLRPFERADLIKCSYCGSIYKLDSAGNIQEDKSSKFILATTVLSLVFSFVAFFLFFKSANKEISPLPPIQENPNQIEEPPKEIEQGAGEILDIQEYKVTQDSFYIVGFYKNTGTSILEKPSIQVNFYNDKNELINTHTGFGYKGALKPNEITSFVVVCNIKDKQFKREIKHYPNTKTYVLKRANIQIQEHKLVKESWMTSVIGKLKNKSEFPAEFVSVKIVFFGKNKKIIASSFTYINEKFLNPSQTASFKVTAYTNEKVYDYWDRD